MHIQQLILKDTTVSKHYVQKEITRVLEEVGLYAIALAFQF